MEDHWGVLMQTLQRAPASVIAYKMGEINLVTISPKYIEIGINYELLPGEVVPYNLKLKHPQISQYSNDYSTQAQTRCYFAELTEPYHPI